MITYDKVPHLWSSCHHHRRDAIKKVRASREKLDQKVIDRLEEIKSSFFEEDDIREIATKILKKNQQRGSSQ